MKSHHQEYSRVLDELLAGTSSRPRRIYHPEPDLSSWLNYLITPLLIIAAVYFISSYGSRLYSWLVSDSLAIQKLEGDVSAIKRIVSGIVPAVKVLAESRQTPVLDFNKEEVRLAVVTSGRAHIRKEAALDSQSLITVPQGVVLLVRQVYGEWISTLTPLGEPGFMHRSVLRME